MKIPLSLLGISNPANNQKIGLDVMLIDNDGAWKGKLSWFNTLDNSWQYPYTFGIGVFIKSLVADTESPTVPTGLAASAINSNSFILTWTPSTDNSGAAPEYEIYNGAVLAGSTQNTSFSLTGLTPATTYQITVKDRDGATPPNVSAASQPITVVTTFVSGIDDEHLDSHKMSIVFKPNPISEGENVEILLNGFQGEYLVLGVYTFSGQILFQTNLQNKDQYTLNGNIFKTGAYLVKVKGKFSVETGKLIVK